MPAILSKPSKILAMCRRQDDVMHAILLESKPKLRLAQQFAKKTCNRIRLSYELLQMHQVFYENCRLVMNQEKSQCLADHFFKGAYPKQQALRILCDYYDMMYKAIDR